MFPLKKFRIGNDCDVSNAISNYLKINYGQDLTYKCRDFIREFSQSRSLLCYLSNTQPENILMNYLTSSSIYIKTLLQFDILIGTDKKNLGLKFSWKEAVNGNTTSSFNVYYEILSIKHNMAIILMELGYRKYNSQDKDLIKQGYKHFIDAATIFRDIIDESDAYFVTKENIPDFSSGYLNSCKNYALAMAQIAILNLSILSKFGNKMLLKISNGIVKLLNNSLIYSINDVDRTEAKFLLYYYSVKVMYYAKLEENEIFNQTGIGIGKILGYINFILNFIKEKNTIFKERFATREEFREIQNIKIMCENEYKVQANNNERIYKKPVIEISQIPNELEVLVKADVLKNKYEIEAEPLPTINALKTGLLSPEMKEKIGVYLKNIKEYINETLQKYETPEKIDSYITKHGLNEIFGETNGTYIISNEVFRDILEIKKQGSIENLYKKISQLNNQYHLIQNKIHNISNIFTNEEEEHKKYINLYGQCWDLPLDIRFREKSNNFYVEISNFRGEDTNITKSIMNDKIYFDLLKYDTKEEIEKMIPKDKNETKIQASPVLEKLQKYTNELFDHKQNLINLIKEIYEKIDNNIPLDDFNKVLKKMVLESNILQEQKDNLKIDFERINEISNEVIKLYPVITELQMTYITQSGVRGNITNNKYLEFFDRIKVRYLNYDNFLNKRMQEYIELETRVDDTQRELNEHLDTRNLVKGDLIEKLQHQFNLNMAGFK